ncbi:S-layer homology domain-containing protein, partial [Agathobaculum butyriciproducens]
METGKTVQPKLVESNIAQAGNTPDAGYRAGSWDVEPKVDMEIKADTVFTYTYARRSSSGGGGGGGSHKPTVTIPDDVPTGLNGDDHFAYIVGYPNGNVEPNGNITRAEVATIFFRLLTEEVRTANSTQSNSLSDVTRGQWFNHAVSTLSSMGIVKGHNDGTFAPNAPITRAE